MIDKESLGPVIEKGDLDEEDGVGRIRDKKLAHEMARAEHPGRMRALEIQESRTGGFSVQVEILRRKLLSIGELSEGFREAIEQAEVDPEGNTVSVINVEPIPDSTEDKKRRVPIDQLRKVIEVMGGTVHMGVQIRITDGREIKEGSNRLERMVIYPENLPNIAVSIGILPNEGEKVSKELEEILSKRGSLCFLFEVIKIQNRTL